MNRDKRKCEVVKDGVIIGGYRTHMKSVAHMTILAWRISDYEKLHSNVMYLQMCDKENIICAFRLFKWNKMLHLCVTGANHLRDTPAEFSILNEVRNESITEQAVKIEDGVFVGKFPEEQFLNENISFLTSGILTVTFKYAADYCKIYRTERFKESEMLTEWDDLCYDLKSMYLDSLFPDFNIHVRGCTFKSHKMVLAARSEYFSDMLKPNKEQLDHTLPDDIMPGILHQVLLYMYCGELMEWDYDFMLQVYKLADFLKVSSLCRRCMDFFVKVIRENNYLEFLEFAVNFDLKELKNKIVHIVADEFKHVNIVDVLKKIEEQKKEVLALGRK